MSSIEGATQSRSSAVKPPVDPYAEIAALARSTPSRSRFLSGVVQCLVRAFGSPYGSVHSRSGAEVMQDDAHAGPTDPRFWKDSLQEFLTESLTEARARAKLLQAKSGGAKVAFLSAPLFDASGPSNGAVALVVPLSGEGDWTTRLAALEGLCRFASLCTRLLGGAPPTAQAARTPDRTLLRAATCDSIEELAFAITNDLRNKLGCEQVAFGWVDRKRVRVLSISGLDQVNNRSPGVADLRAAMEECLDAASAIAHPSPESDTDRTAQPEYPLHKQWHATAKGDAVASVPLLTGSDVVAVLSLRSRADRALLAGQLAEVGAKTELLIPALVMARRATRSLPRHAWETVRGAVSSVAAPGRWGKKVTLSIAAVLALTFCFGSMRHDLTVRSVVTPAAVRHIHAPFAGVLAAAHVVQGDRVRAGDLLCEFDHRDLDQQRTELLAQMEVLERERDRALAAHAPVEASLATANQQLIRAKLEIVERRIEQSRVVSPIDGTVIRGDLQKAVGAMMSFGDPLFQIAEENRWTLELEVPDAGVDDLTLGLQGEFVSSAEPGQVIPFAVNRIRASAETRQSHNVFVAEADVNGSSRVLKAGMEGTARVHVGKRRVAWVVGHRLIDYLRLNFWL